MSHTRGNLMPSQLSDHDHHLMPPDTQEEPEVYCVATRTWPFQCDAVEIEDGKWVSKSFLGELLQWYEEMESWTSKLEQQVSKAFEGEFDLEKFNSHVKFAQRGLTMLAKEAGKIGGVG